MTAAQVAQMLAGVNPAFAAACAPGLVLAQRRAAYVAALLRHDWSHEYSDDQTVWARGRAERAALTKMQAELDQSLTLWNQHAPSAYRIGPLDEAQP